MADEKSTHNAEAWGIAYALSLDRQKIAHKRSQAYWLHVRCMKRWNLVSPPKLLENVRRSGELFLEGG